MSHPEILFGKITSSKEFSFKKIYFCFMSVNIFSACKCTICVCGVHEDKKREQELQTVLSYLMWGAGN